MAMRLATTVVRAVPSSMANGDKIKASPRPTRTVATAVLVERHPMALRLSASQVKMAIRARLGLPREHYLSVRHVIAPYDAILESCIREPLARSVLRCTLSGVYRQSAAAAPVLQIGANKGFKRQLCATIPIDQSPGQGSNRGTEIQCEKDRYPLCIGWRFGCLGQGK